MFVAWIRFFHFRIWNTYLAIRQSRTSGRDGLQNILETTHVHRVVFHRHKLDFILKTSSGVGHTTVDRLWDDDSLANQTTRPERLPLTVLLTAYSQCWIYTVTPALMHLNYYYATIICTIHLEIWTSPIDSTLLRLLQLALVVITSSALIHL